MHKKIYPSLMAADVLRLADVVKELEPHCDGFHNDIMDNHFVPNLTWGPLISNALAALSTKPLWNHLMVDKPETIINALTIRAHDIVSFHIESTKNVKETIQLIEKKGGIASLAISPGTPLEALYDYLPLVNHVVLMSVKPGFSGQKFIEQSYNRLEGLAEHRIAKDLHFVIGMDGGITASNIAQLSEKGCNDFAIASAIFNAENPVTAVNELRSRTLL